MAINESKLRVGMTPEHIKNYLDNNIRHWRKKRGKGSPIAIYYIDAYQSVRISIFGESLPGGTFGKDGSALDPSQIDKGE